MSRDVFHKLDHGLQRDDEVLVDGDWFPIIGYAGDSLFTSKPRGKYEPWMGYLIDVAEVIDCRRPKAIE